MFEGAPQPSRTKPAAPAGTDPMKNDFCDLPQEQIRALRIPDDVAGYLLSPFQYSQENGYVWVPAESFKEMIDLITAHALELDAKARAGNCA